MSHAISFDCDDLAYEKNSHVATLRHDEGMFDFVRRDYILETSTNPKQAFFS